MNMNKKVNSLLKSALKTAVYFLEQSDSIAEDTRNRVDEGIDRATDRMSDLRDRAKDALYRGENHTARNVVMFMAGIGVGIGAGILFAPASGEETRTSFGDKVHDFGQRVRDRVSPEVKPATGTDAP
jgi:hypothetical protein